jgi:ElaA protein
MLSCTFEVKKFSELSASLLYDILKLRCEVFVVEQACAYPDIDGADRETWHLIGTMKENPETVVAYARLFAPHNTVGSHSPHPSNGASDEVEAGTPEEQQQAFSSRLTEPLPYARIGRVMVAPTHRQHKLGRLLMERSIAVCRSLWPNVGIQIGAQCYLEKFYKSFGFEISSDVYDDYGIPHVDMILAGESTVMSTP